MAQASTVATAAEGDVDDTYEMESLTVDESSIDETDLEQDSELARLEMNVGKWALVPGNGYENQWYRATEDSESARQNSDVFIISLLGNTTAGKSFISKYFFKDNEKKPHVMEEGALQGSTTGNVNCFESNGMTDTMNRTLVLDFEGEKGTARPLMLRARRFMRDSFAVMGHGKEKKRADAVSEYFPKLAYILSNIVILIGREEIVSSDYLTRCCEFAERANAGVSQVVYRPVLLIIQNQSPLANQFGIKEVTDEFFLIHRENERLQFLRSYFSEILCMRLPHNEVSQPVKGVMREGKKIFSEQVETLKEKFATIYLEHKRRLLTHAQWLYLFDLVLPIVSSGQSVSIHTLLAEVTATGDENETIARRLFVSLYSTRSVHSPEWYKHCREFAVKGLARYLALNFLDNEKIISDRVIHDNCRENLPALWKILEAFLPCEAVKPTFTNSRFDRPIVCYQHKGAHQSHRSSETPTFLPNFIGRLFAPTWEGEFETSAEHSPTEEMIDDFERITTNYYNVFKKSSHNAPITFKKLLDEYQLDERHLSTTASRCLSCLDTKNEVLRLPEQPLFRDQLRFIASLAGGKKAGRSALCSKCTLTIQAALDGEQLNLATSAAQHSFPKSRTATATKSTTSVSVRKEIPVSGRVTAEPARSMFESAVTRSSGEAIQSEKLKTADYSKQVAAAAYQQEVVTEEAAASPTTRDKNCVLCGNAAELTDHCFVPCGHKGFCEKCAVRMKGLGFCPACGKLIESTLKLQKW